MAQLLVKGGTLVSSSAVYEADLLADEGRIVAIGHDLGASAAEVLDARGLLVLPGGVDVHTHMPWPAGSFISTDTIATGTRAALFGGVTTLLDFAIPADDQPLREALQDKLDQARESAWVDYSFHLNIRGDVTPKLAEIPALVADGFPSFKVFLAYEGFRLDDADLLSVLQATARSGGMVTAHAEDGPLADFLTSRLLEEGSRALSCYPLARPASCEELAVTRLLEYQRLTGARLHIHHVSTARAARLIGKSRRAGQPVSAETCPHYLVFTDLDYTGDPVRAAALVCAPSIKSAGDQQVLWQALAGGDLQAVATDHCPYTRAQKEGDLADFSAVPGGMPGVETRLPLLYSEGVLKGRLTHERLASVWAEGPAAALGLTPRKGSLAVGADADLALLDPSARWTVRAAGLHSQTDLSPYEGMSLTGRVTATVLRGEIQMQDNLLKKRQPAGQLIYRKVAGLT